MLEKSVVRLQDIGKRGLFDIISLTELYFRETAAGFDHTHHEEQHQQGIANGFQTAVDIDDHGPHPAALEILRAGGDQRPELRQFVVPGGQSGVQVVYDPVSTSYV